ncbi:MAG: tetratricopeptide (TPR) repeat protein, partial [Polyangiales bacterium]
MIRRRILAGLAAIGVVAVGFVVFGADDDAAEREYTAYLRSDEDGSAARNEARLDRAIGLEPGRSHYYEARGTLRIDAGDAEGALDDYDRAITLADRPYVRYLRASALSQRGDYLRALTDFDHAI